MSIFRSDRLFAILGAASIAASLSGMTLSSASAQTSGRESSSQSILSQRAVANDYDGATIQAVRHAEAQTTSGEDVTRIQVPTMNGGLKWVVEEDQSDD